MKTLLYIFIFYLTTISYGQDPQLFDNDWYLQKVNIDGVDHFPPQNSEIESVNLEFRDFSTSYSMLTYICSSISADINDIDNQFIYVLGFFIIDGNCTLPETIAFEDLYFNGFFDWQEPNQTFSYLIEPGVGNIKILTLTNLQGDIAIYGNTELSIFDNLSSQLTLYPNPVKSQLFLTSKSTTGNLKVKIFNLEGKLLSTQDVVLENQTSIDVSSLISGIYFLNVEDESGYMEVKKFLKE